MTLVFSMFYQELTDVNQWLSGVLRLLLFDTWIAFFSFFEITKHTNLVFYVLAPFFATGWIVNENFRGSSNCVMTVSNERSS